MIAERAIATRIATGPAPRGVMRLMDSPNIRLWRGNPGAKYFVLANEGFEGI
jgi:hypothetical protein